MHCTPLREIMPAFNLQTSNCVSNVQPAVTHNTGSHASVTYPGSLRTEGVA